MATIKAYNFSYDRRNEIDASNGDIFVDCNFAQAVPHTAICEGLTGLTFIRCNLVNCDVPGDSVIEKCNTIQKSKCSHLHPGLAAWLPECEEECDHVDVIDEIYVDGVLVDTVYYYKDEVVS